MPDRVWIAVVLLTLSPGLTAQVSGDFDADGSVGFSDFLLFAAAFGSDDPVYDLDGNGTVGFGDFLVFAASFSSGTDSSDGTPDVAPTETIDGPILIESAADLTDLLERVTVDSFAVAGDLRIVRSDLTTLSRLAGLRSIGGDLTIQDNGLLSSLSGLDRIRRVGDDLRIVRNPSLTDLSGLGGLETVAGDLVLTGNRGLRNVRDLEALTSVSGLIAIRDNTSLESLVGLGRITSTAGSVLIEDNASLNSLVGLGGLVTIGQVLSVRNNASLATLEGLDGLTTVEGIVITDNARLLESDAERFLAEMRARGFSGLTTVENNNFNADLVVLTGPFTALSRNDLGALRGAGGDRFMIDGSLIVRADSLQNMEPLLTLVEITGDLEIDQNPMIVNLDGLFSLRTVGEDLEIKGNADLRSLVGISNLQTVRGDLVIFRNRRLVSLDGLQRLQVVGGSIRIEENELLPAAAVEAFRDTMRVRGFDGVFVEGENGP